MSSRSIRRPTRPSPGLLCSRPRDHRLPASVGFRRRQKRHSRLPAAELSADCLSGYEHAPRRQLFDAHRSSLFNSRCAGDQRLLSHAGDAHGGIASGGPATGTLPDLSVWWTGQSIPAAIFDCVRQNCRTSLRMTRSLRRTKASLMAWWLVWPRAWVRALAAFCRGCTGHTRRTSGCSGL